MHGFKGEVVLGPEVDSTLPEDCAVWALRRVVAAREVEARYVPTPLDVVAAMLELAQVTDGDTLYDAGCGDGRFVIMAAQQYGARGVGIDIDAWCIAESRENARRAGVEHLVSFYHGDALDADLSPATVLALYMPVLWNWRLLPKVRQELAAGSRIVAYVYGLPGWVPAETRSVTDQYGRQSPIFLWYVGHEPNPV